MARDTTDTPTPRPEHGDGGPDQVRQVPAVESHLPYHSRADDKPGTDEDDPTIDPPRVAAGTTGTTSPGTGLDVDGGRRAESAPAATTVDATAGPDVEPPTEYHAPDRAAWAADRQRATDAVAHGLDRSGDDGTHAALSQSYDVARGYTAPFMVKVANDMLDDLRTEAAENPERQVAFVGRDGLSLALAVKALDPDYYDRHCTAVVLSRASVETAVLDLELNAGESFDAVSDFRQRKGEPVPEDVQGAYQQLTRYLRAEDLPVGRPGSEVTLVDTSYKGSVQELLSSIYPDTSFQGKYAFFGASPHDPHPETKRGYVVHLDADRSSGGRPVGDLPDDPALTFSHQEAIGLIEDTMHGTWTSPSAVDAAGPVQQPQRLAPDPLRGLNPLRVCEAYKDPVVREGVKDINHYAVVDYAAEIGRQRDRGEDWLGQLAAGSDRFVQQARAWVGRGNVDPQFAEVMDSFVRRTDKSSVTALHTALDRAGTGEEDALAVWRAYDRLPTRADKQAFAAGFAQDHDL